MSNHYYDLLHSNYFYLYDKKQYPQFFLLLTLPRACDQFPVLTLK